jgi:ribosomal protein S18 acetylase RimI-like enzyme
MIGFLQQDMKANYIVLSELSPTQKAEVAILMGLCEGGDGASTCIEFDTYLNYDKSMAPYVLAYEEGERGRLIGAATLFAPMKEEVELSACVLPEFRRRGLYAGLLAQVRELIAGREVRRILYVVDRASTSGTSMLEAQGLSIHHSEYAMRFSGSRPLPGKPVLELRAATMADMDSLVSLGASGFGDSPDEARSFIAAKLESPDREQLIALAGAPGTASPVAMVSLGRENGGAISITGLCVAPSRRGEGFGRSIMERTLGLLLDRGESPIVLDVDSENEVAHRLYLSLGFKQTQVVDYYLETLAR